LGQLGSVSVGQFGSNFIHCCKRCARWCRKEQPKIGPTCPYMGHLGFFLLYLVLAQGAPCKNPGCPT
jgi:hypothetical protein